MAEIGRVGQATRGESNLTRAEQFAGKRAIIPNINAAMFKAAKEEVLQGGLDL